MADTLLALVDAHAAGRDAIARQVLARVAAAFGGFDGWYSDRLVAEVAAEAYAAILSGQKTLAALTDTYLARSATIIAGRSVNPVGVALQFPLRGIPGDQELSRVAAEYRYLTSRGASKDQALTGAMGRAKRMSEADLTQAFTEQSKRFMVGRKVDGFRRIVHPELARTGSCGLCFVAADREYRRADLMPVHNSCHCGVLPIIDGNDPGQDLDIGAVYSEADSTDGRELKKVRVKVVEHSELGPQLTFANRKTRTAAQAEADTIRS